MVDFTVAIPTYNGEQRLPDVLERLQAQIGIDHLTIQILIIDNNSKDNTETLVYSYQQNFPYPLCYIRETRQGAGFARQRAVREAHSELIGFLDDDNLPFPNWIAAAYDFAQTHPAVGAYGSRIHGLFEVEPPHHLRHLLPFLAIVERGVTPQCYNPKKRLLPPSAGLVVRKQVWLDHVPAETILGGRIDGNMLTGEDLEAISYIQQAGWEIWYNPMMEIDHKIPRWRLEKDYLIPFFKGVGLSRHVTRMLSVSPARRPFMFMAFLLYDAYRAIFHYLKYRSRLSTDLAAACKMQLFMGSLESPFYLYRKGYFSRQRSLKPNSSHPKSVNNNKRVLY